jgi:hypothetical protein
MLPDSVITIDVQAIRLCLLTLLIETWTLITCSSTASLDLRHYRAPGNGEIGLESVCPQYSCGCVVVATTASNVTYVNG